MSIKKADIDLVFDKLRNYYYYEKNDIVTRNKIFRWDKGKLDDLYKIIKNKDLNLFDYYLNEIDLTFYPKKIKEEQFESHEGNFYSNHKISESTTAKDFLIFIDAPVELHIISALWILKIGIKLESQLSDNNCFGNRLFDKQINKHKPLFKKYHYQYKQWWNQALIKSKELLKEKKNVSLLTFDIKSFYHSITFDFSKLDSYVIESDENDLSFLNKLLELIHKIYKNKLQQYTSHSLNHKENEYPLPIGFLSSFILSNYYLLDFDKKLKASKYDFYGRYVDDIILVYSNKSKSNSKNPINTFVNKNLSMVFKEKTDDIDFHFRARKYSKLKLQKEKVYLYEFSYKASPSMLNVLIEEQKQRSSEFRFLSDAEDENFTDIETVIFENTFEFEDGNKAKFKEVNENKFKLSSYLAKLIQKKIENKKEYKKDEIEKIYNYFKGKYYLKNYFFWEKILTLYVVSERYDLLKNTIKEIQKQIDTVEIEGKDWKFQVEKLKTNLDNYLYESIVLAVNLKRKSLSRAFSNYMKSNACIREHYSIFPFLPYLKSFQDDLYDVTSIGAIEEIKDNDSFDIQIDNIPTSKMFYWCYYYEFFKMTFNEHKFSNQKIILKRALNIYNQINGTNFDLDKFCKINEIKSINYEKIEAFEIYGKHLNHENGNCRIAVLNELVDLNEKKLFDVESVIGKNKFEATKEKLDRTSKIEKLDILVKPELSIPYPTLFKEIAQSAKNKYSLNSGIYYIVSKNCVFNFVISTIPIRSGYTNDCVPIIRLKNLYSIKESEAIIKNKKNIPKSKKREYHIIRTKGISLSAYYCYELTSIEDRSIFKSMIDVIVAPIWNMDSYYYRAISESLVRDLHIFYAQSNTSSFPDSRVLQPTRSLTSEMAKVNNGTINQGLYSFNYIICDLNIKALRNFQSIDNLFRKNNDFKPLPPDWDFKNVENRKNNISIVTNKNLDMEDITDDLPF